MGPLRSSSARLSATRPALDIQTRAGVGASTGYFATEGSMACSPFGSRGLRLTTLLIPVKKVLTSQVRGSRCVLIRLRSVCGVMRRRCEHGLGLWSWRGAESTEMGR